MVVVNNCGRKKVEARGEKTVYFVKPFLPAPC